MRWVGSNELGGSGRIVVSSESIASPCSWLLCGGFTTAEDVLSECRNFSAVGSGCARRLNFLPPTVGYERLTQRNSQVPRM